MRNEERFIKTILPKVLESLPPRIRKDVQNIKAPTFLGHPIDSTYIYGSVGVGKTIRASFMLIEEKRRLFMNKELNIENKECIFSSTPELLMEIKQSFQEGSTKSEYDIIKFYSDVHLLILDDFGTIKPTDWVLQTLYTIINHRYDYLKKTIFTSNLSLKEVAEVLGDNRITARIDRMCLLEKKLNKFH